MPDASTRNPRLFAIDREIGRIIASHQGAENPITIREIAALLWGGELEAGQYTYERCRRAVEAGVARLVNSGEMVIIANRGRRPGYFVPARKEEIDRAARTTARQAVAMFRRLYRLTRDHSYLETAGQLKMRFGTEQRQASGARETRNLSPGTRP